MPTVPLRQLAHARSGDKGNRSNICIFVYEARYFELVKAQISPSRLKAELGGLFKGEIVRYE